MAELEKIGREVDALEKKLWFFPFIWFLWILSNKTIKILNNNSSFNFQWLLESNWYSSLVKVENFSSFLGVACNWKNFGPRFPRRRYSHSNFTWPTSKSLEKSHSVSWSLRFEPFTQPAYISRRLLVNQVAVSSHEDKKRSCRRVLTSLPQPSI